MCCKKKTYISSQTKHLITTNISTNKDKYKIGETIELIYEIKNNSNTSFTFLPWGTPLESRFTRDCLNIIYKKECVKYSGAMVKRSAPTKKDFITLKINETITGKIDVLKGYKLPKKGAYTVQFKESNKIPASNLITIEIN